MIHKLSTQMNVGQEAEGSGGAAGRRKTGLEPSLTRYDAVLKKRNQISWRLFPAEQNKNFSPQLRPSVTVRDVRCAPLLKTLWAAVCVGECLQNRKPVLIFGAVPIAGTVVEEGRGEEKKETGKRD